MDRLLAFFCMTLPLTACAACGPLSQRAADEAAGLNGGFEVVREGLPVAWNVYTPQTVPDARFVLALDEEQRHEGLRALRFDVEKCSGEAGWRSPGLTREIAIVPGATYDVSFWVRSEGARWSADVGGVAAKTGALEQLESAQADDGRWARVERRVTVPEDFERLRFQFNVRSPGRLWLDDVRVERASG